MLLSLCILMTSLVGINCQSTSYYCGNISIYYGPSGVIYSPNYPSAYRSSSNCTYKWNVPALSSATLRIQFLDVEASSSNCGFDSVEFSCRSHSVALPSRYCGRGQNLNPITFTPCTEVQIRFKTDGSVTGGGFAISYRADPLECSDNCTVLTNSYGYICSCNGTTAAMPTMAPYPQCMGGCTRQSTSSSVFCNCLVSGSIYTTSRCLYPCSLTYDYYGNPTCTCTQSVTTPRACPAGCYRTTDYLGYLYCSCPSSTASPLTCPYGCYVEADYWGNQYCNCQRSTQPPIWCSSGCVSDINVYGERYCRCPTTTLPPCFSPCYYTWDYTYDYSGQRICYCPPTTTMPPPTGCNQTLRSSYGTVTSPNYPNAYPKGIDCYQYIAVPMASSITIRVIDMSVYYSSSYSCVYEYVEITGCDGSITQFCASSTFPTSGLVLHCTEHPFVTIRFRSYLYSSYYSGYTGFKLSYSAGFSSNCSESGNYLSQGSSGVITSPNYPNNYPVYSECINYLFTDDDNIRTTITFDQLRLEDSATCANVFVKLTCQDGSGNTRTVCGSRIPSPMTFDCRTIQIWFKSNATTSLNPRNYKLRYYATSRNPTTADLHPTVIHYQSGETDFPNSYKIGIGLGVGVGGFLLIILIVIVIILIVSNHRQAARRDQRHLEDLTVICRNMNGGRGPVQSDSVGFVRRAPNAGHPGPNETIFPNPMVEVAVQPPTYTNGGYNGGTEGLFLGGFVAEQPDEPLLVA